MPIEQQHRYICYKQNVIFIKKFHQIYIASIQFNIGFFRNDINTVDSFDSGEKHDAQHNRQKVNKQIDQRDDDVNLMLISPDSSVDSINLRAQSKSDPIGSNDEEISMRQGHNIVSVNSHKIYIFRSIF